MSDWRPSVVIVDDHASFRRAARQLFAARGYVVIGEASCGAAAQTIVERCAPDLVVLDVRLGAENGLDVARTLTRAFPSLAVLLVSANEDVAGEAQVVDCGACGFLPKLCLATADLDALWL